MIDPKQASMAVLAADIEFAQGFYLVLDLISSTTERYTATGGRPCGRLQSDLGLERNACAAHGRNDVDRPRETKIAL